MRILNYLQRVNFRHIYATLILLTFILITTLPFWIGSKELSQHSWTYLVSSQGAVIVLLTLAGRRYFEIKSNQEEIKNDTNNNTPNIVSHKQCSCGLSSTSLPEINIQPLK